MQFNHGNPGNKIPYSHYMNQLYENSCFTILFEYMKYWLARIKVDDLCL